VQRGDLYLKTVNLPKEEGGSGGGGQKGNACSSIEKGEKDKHLATVITKKRILIAGRGATPRVIHEKKKKERRDKGPIEKVLH